MRLNNLSRVIIILLLLSSVLLNGYLYLDNRSLREGLKTGTDQDKQLSGIVLYMRDNTVWLKLSSPDSLNDRQAGEIAQYTLDNDSAVKVGDYIEGTLTDGNTLTAEFTTYFYDGNRIVTDGKLVLFSGGHITDKEPYPTLSFQLKSLGAEIIAIRAKVNDVDMPNAFGVSPDSPIRPMGLGHYTCYTAWRTPGGGTGGYVPMDGESYNVTVMVKLSDYSIQAFTSSGVFKTINDTIQGAPATIPRKGIVFQEPDLLWLGRGQGSSLSLSFWNEWYDQKEQTVDKLQLIVDGELVWSEPDTVKPLRSLIVTIHVPGELVPWQRYNVTLVAHSMSGLNSTYTVPTLCQNARIQ